MKILGKTSGKTWGSMQNKSGFFHYLFSAQLKLLRSPDSAFEELLEKPDMIRIGALFVMSTIIYCCASLIVNSIGQPVNQVAVLAVNTMGMVLVEIVLGYIFVAILTGTFISLKTLSVIYAVSWSAMLLIAWIPFTLWITEPWKWVLIGIGLRKQYKLKGRMAVFIVLGSIVTIVFIFKRFIPSAVANIG